MVSITLTRIAPLSINQTSLNEITALARSMHTHAHSLAHSAPQGSQTDNVKKLSLPSGSVARSQTNFCSSLENGVWFVQTCCGGIHMEYGTF